VSLTNSLSEPRNIFEWFINRGEESIAWGRVLFRKLRVLPPTQKIPWILRNVDVHYRVHRSLSWAHESISHPAILFIKDVASIPPSSSSASNKKSLHRISKWPFWWHCPCNSFLLPRHSVSCLGPQEPPHRTEISLLTTVLLTRRPKNRSAGFESCSRHACLCYPRSPVAIRQDKHLDTDQRSTGTGVRGSTRAAEPLLVVQ
jgi:hypothetical protein